MVNKLKSEIVKKCVNNQTFNVLKIARNSHKYSTKTSDKSKIPIYSYSPKNYLQQVNRKDLT